MLTVFIDLDGTLVEESGPYATRKWLPYGKKLLAMINNYNPVVLTWARDSDGIKQKELWFKENAPDTKFLITLKNVPKAAHAKPGDILIDNGKKHRDLWEKAGGIFILHKNYEDTEGLFLSAISKC